MYYIFAFKSRTSAMNFYDSLKRNGILSSVVNTPPAAQLGCGLSVKINPESLPAARRVFSHNSFGSYLGLFRVRYTRGRYDVERV